MDELRTQDAVLRALKAAADGIRLRILRVLAEGPFHVAELTEILGAGQSSVSRHLRILADAELVQVRRVGTWSWYSLREGSDEGAPAARVLSILEALPGLNGDAEAVDRVLAKRRHATSEFFRRTAPVWDTVRERHLGPAEHLEPLLDAIGRGRVVADLGTGTGVLLARLASTFDQVIGIDASPEMLEEARRRLDDTGSGPAELRLGRLEHLPLADGEADVMVANLVLHHVADPAGVLREIRRGLASRGRLVIADLEEYADDSLRSALGAQWPGFRPDDVTTWLRAAGFTPRRSERITRPNGAEPGPAIHLWEAIAR
ncbi:MAG: metalloregulator ArsR/SmtB family transcription factor [bacterium]